MSDAKFRSLRVTRFVPVNAPGTVVGMVVGNMISDIHERAYFLDVILEPDSLRVTTREVKQVGDITGFEIVAEMQGAPL